MTGSVLLVGSLSSTHALFIMMSVVKSNREYQQVNELGKFLELVDH